jgi:uncharacterized membrane protein
LSCSSSCVDASIAIRQASRGEPTLEAPLPMKTASSIVDIDAPVQVVWPILAAVEHWPSWTPTVIRVEPVNAAELAIGHRFRIKQPKLRPSVWVVCAIEPGVAFSWESRNPGLRMFATHTLTSLGPHTSRLELTFALEGLLAGLVGALFGSLVRSYVTTEAVSLKRRAEEHAAGQQTARLAGSSQR